MVLSALLLIYAAEQSSYYMDVAMILALLAFVSTLVAARYYGERKVF